MEQGFDGWRLDVPNEIDDDPFWYDFRKVVRRVNENAYLLGEIWDGNSRWVGDRHFDGLMNYPVRTLLVDLLQQKLHPSEFVSGIDSWLKKYPRENVYAQYNLLGSHDTERIMTVFKGNQEKVKLAMLFLFTYPGAPAVYYGDEIGLTGGSDPDCRKTFPWDETRWNNSLRQWVRKLIWTRRDRNALRYGELEFLDLNNKECVGYYRKTQEDTALIIINPSEKQQEISFTHSTDRQVSTFRSAFTLQPQPVDNGIIRMTLPPFTGELLFPQN
jgi:glycosidase